MCFHLGTARLAEHRDPLQSLLEFFDLLNTCQNLVNPRLDCKNTLISLLFSHLAFSIKNKRRAIELQLIDIALSGRCDAFERTIASFPSMEFQVIAEWVKQSRVIRITPIFAIELIAGMAGVNGVFRFIGTVCTLRLKVVEGSVLRRFPLRTAHNSRTASRKLSAPNA